MAGPCVSTHYTWALATECSFVAEQYDTSCLWKYPNRRKLSSPVASLSIHRWCTYWVHQSASDAMKRLATLISSTTSTEALISSQVTRVEAFTKLPQRGFVTVVLQRAVCVRVIRPAELGMLLRQEHI